MSSIREAMLQIKEERQAPPVVQEGPAAEAAPVSDEDGDVDEVSSHDDGALSVDSPEDDGSEVQDHVSEDDPQEPEYLEILDHKSGRVRKVEAPSSKEDIQKVAKAAYEVLPKIQSERDRLKAKLDSLNVEEVEKTQKSLKAVAELIDAGQTNAALSALLGEETWQSVVKGIHESAEWRKSATKAEIALREREERLALEELSRKQKEDELLSREERLKKEAEEAESARLQGLCVPHFAKYQVMIPGKPKATERINTAIWEEATSMLLQAREAGKNPSSREIAAWFKEAYDQYAVETAAAKPKRSVEQQRANAAKAKVGAAKPPVRKAAASIDERWAKAAEGKRSFREILAGLRNN